MASLLSSDSEEEGRSSPVPSTSTGGFTVNQSYARSYEQFRHKEVFQRLKDKYGEEAARDRIRDAQYESDTSSSEDEDGREWTEQVDRDFFRTLSCLKGGDPKIYDKDREFFRQGQRVKRSKKEEREPVYLGDLERKVILEKGGKFEELEDEGLARESRGTTYAQEQEDIRRSLALKMNEDEDEDEDEGEDGWLKKKEKTEEEVKEEEEDYKVWLAGKKSSLGDQDAEQELKGLRDFWTSKNLDKDEKFLRDYVLNMNKAGQDSDSDEDEGPGGRLHDSDEGLSEDERTLGKMEEFEHKFNFRFEEPDQDFIKRYPRTTADSMRRQDNKRASKREEARARKDEEKRKRQEELKQLKAMKRKEIEDKLQKLAKVAGSKDLDFLDDDVEGDFDPEEHDRRMAELFGQYDDVPVEDEDEKPQFSDLESDEEEALEVENWDEWTGKDDEEEEADSGQYQGEGMYLKISCSHSLTVVSNDFQSFLCRCGHGLRLRQQGKVSARAHRRHQKREEEEKVKVRPGPRGEAPRVRSQAAQGLREVPGRVLQAGLRGRHRGHDMPVQVPQRQVQRLWPRHQRDPLGSGQRTQRLVFAQEDLPVQVCYLFRLLLTCTRFS